MRGEEKLFFLLGDSSWKSVQQWEGVGSMLCFLSVHTLSHADWHLNTELRVSCVSVGANIWWQLFQHSLQLQVSLGYCWIWSWLQIFTARHNLQLGVKPALFFCSIGCCRRSQHEEMLLHLSWKWEKKGFSSQRVLSVFSSQRLQVFCCETHCWLRNEWLSSSSLRITTQKSSLWSWSPTISQPQVHHPTPSSAATSTHILTTARWLHHCPRQLSQLFKSSQPFLQPFPLL